MEESTVIRSDGISINVIINHADNPSCALIIAHGSGASMEHKFLNTLAHSFQEQGITAIRFNFPYMDQGKKFPGNPKINISAWSFVANWANENFEIPIFISGKSYGGRMASHLIAENKLSFVKGIIYFGFPLHAPGKHSMDRACHLSNLHLPQLFLQGTNDALADIELMRSLVSSIPLAKLIEFGGADHSFKAKGKKIDQIIKDIVSTTIGWINSHN